MKISDTLQNTIDVKGPTPQSAQPEAPKPELAQIETSKSEAETKEGTSQQPKLSREETEELVEALEDLAETIQTKLNFSINETTNDIVVKIMDKDNETVIKQFPSEELLELQEKMIDLTGFLFDRDV